MVSENVNVWTNDRAEWFGNDEIPIEESLYAPLDGKLNNRNGK